MKQTPVKLCIIISKLTQIITNVCYNTGDEWRNKICYC